MMCLLLAGMALFAAKVVVQAADCLDVAQAEIPSCAQPCFLENAPSVGCGGLDFTCQCQNEATLYAAIEPCVASTCSESYFQAVIDGASSVCDCATAITGTLAVGSSFASFAGAATVTGTVAVPATVVGVVSDLVGTGTVVTNPTSTSVTEASATSKAPQSGARSYQSDLWPAFTMQMAVLAMLPLIFF